MEAEAIEQAWLGFAEKVHALAASIAGEPTLPISNKGAADPKIVAAPSLFARHQIFGAFWLLLVLDRLSKRGP